MASIAFGCRKIGTKEGSWAGAFVFVEQGETRVSALFENGMDFIGHPKSLGDGIRAYQTYIDQGWIPMTAHDITETSGVSVNDKTATYEDAMRDYHP